MALTVTYKEASLGHRRMKYGTATATGVTSGDVVTGLNTIENFQTQIISGTGVSAISISGGTATLTLSASDVVHWLAIGE